MVALNIRFIFNDVGIGSGEFLIPVLSRNKTLKTSIKIQNL